MRVYVDKDRKELQQVKCNQCGKTLKMKNGMILEGIYEGNQKFGYFSNKDGMQYSFDLCEECFDRLLSGFSIAAAKEELKELL